MKLNSTLAYVLGSAAAGGALYLGISKMTGAKAAKSASREKMLVRVTENGRKYHRDNCPLLHGETRVINVSEALENYEPCKACHPPGGIDVAEDEAMDPKRAASRITSDANGTTARTNASAQLERDAQSKDVQSKDAQSKEALSKDAQSKAGGDQSPARVVDAQPSSTRSGNTSRPTATAGTRTFDGTQEQSSEPAGTGMANDPVGEATDRGVEG